MISCDPTSPKINPMSQSFSNMQIASVSTFQPLIRHISAKFTGHISPAGLVYGSF